jgi:uncharacterized damage-inducible protein DinB
MSFETLFLSVSANKLTQSADRIAICLGKLSDDQIWARGHENENAVGNLVLHLCGNVRQWIMHGLGGQPDIRVRDSEFAAAGGVNGAELTAQIRGTIEEAVKILGTLPPDRLTQSYQIQGRSASGVEAVMSVVEHFAQHTGQIIYATKNLTGQDLGLVMPRKR